MSLRDPNLKTKRLQKCFDSNCSELCYIYPSGLQSFYCVSHQKPCAGCGRLYCENCRFRKNIIK